MRSENVARVAGADADLAACLTAFATELDFVYRALQRQGVAANDAEDLAQDVFVILWRRWGALDRGRPLRPWLSGVIVKLAQQYRKRAGRFLPGGLLDCEDTREAIDDQLGEARGRALVLRALSELSDQQRAVVVMFDLDGLPMREIAAQLEVPLFTAYTRLRAGRRNLAATVDRLQASPTDRSTRGAAIALLRRARRTEGPPADLAHRLLARLRLPELTAATESASDDGLARAQRPGRPWLNAGLAATVVLAVAAWRAPGLRPGPNAAATRGDVAAGAGARLLTSARPPSNGGRSTEANAGRALARGLIGYWRFDEPAGSAATTVADLSGGGNDCLVRAKDPAVRGRWVEGATGGALALDGSRWLECPRVDRLAQLETELTISLWLRTPPGGLEARQALVTRQFGVSGDRLFSLRLQRGSLEFLSHVWKTLLRRPYAGEGWTHLAAVRDASGTQLYLGGMRVGRNIRTEPGAIGGGTGALIVGGQVNGREPGAAQDLFRGAIDELLIYDRALSADEIAALAARTQPALTP